MRQSRGATPLPVLHEPGTSTTRWPDPALVIIDPVACLPDHGKSLTIPSTQGTGARNAVLVAAGVVPEEIDQVAFLEQECRRRCKPSLPPQTQVTACHGWRRPERDDEAEIDRVPHKPVEERGAKTGRRIGLQARLLAT